VVRPWFTNVAKALRKEPKWFLRDWSGIDDAGQRAETFVACHLLKAVEGWTDLGLGSFELRYLRDKLKREVDFLVVRDRKPWFLAEVRTGDTRTIAVEVFIGHSCAFESIERCVLAHPIRVEHSAIRHNVDAGGKQLHGRHRHA
jgi:hypothetical protein